MILVTGASRGIGQALAEHFIARGEKVAGAFVASTPPAGADHLSRVDVSDYAAVEAWVNATCEGEQRITLINCAGANYSAFAHKADVAEWERILRVNLLGTFHTIRAVLPFMRAAGYGRIINFSSVVPQIGVPGTSAYAASKAGLWGLTKSVAAENARLGITINSINLGYFEIGMIEVVPDTVKEQTKARIPSGKFGEPQDIIRCVEYLRASDYINGTSIDLNGGIF
jgi:acetoacetyl-CoA reductase/3-oxoacyl-[acyl-carrier protein] reductase